MRWPSFEHAGVVYDLGHLHPKTITYWQPASGTNPPRGYKADIIYSLHCFTRSMHGETPDPGLLYSDSRETRIFDFRRYDLSRHLPAIIESLITCKCFHAGRGNFFTVRVLDEHGNKVDYEIYFTVSRSSRQGAVNLYIQSAYARDAEHRSNKPRISPRPVRFSVILFNTLNRKPIKAP